MTKKNNSNTRLIGKAITRLPSLYIPVLLAVVLAVGALVTAWPEEPLRALYRVLLLDYVFLPLFAFLTYETSSRLLSQEGFEVFRTIPAASRGITKTAGLFLWVLLTLICLLQFVGLWIHAGTYDFSFGQIGKNLVLSLLLYAYLPGITGIVFGLSVSQDKVSQAYISILLIGILMSPVMPKILFNSPIGLKTKLDQWISLSVPSGMTVDHLYGIPVEGSRFVLAFFWLFLFLFIWQAGQKEKGSVRKLIVVLCLISCIASGISFSLRGNQYRMDTVSNHGQFFEDYNYYETREDRPASEADFCIDAYELSLKIGNKLEATAVLTLSPGSRGKKEYYFTLHHGLTCQSVKDEKDQALRFEQNADQLDVFIETEEGPETLVFSYQGNMTFYADYQGICLHTSAAFYPLPGHQTLWNREKQRMEQAVLSETVQYLVKVESPLRVYSNLVQTEENCFSGEAGSIILYAGRVREKHNEAIYVWEPLSGDVDWIPEEDAIMKAWKVLADFLQIPESMLTSSCLQKIFVLPIIPLSETRIQLADDFMTLRFLDVEMEAVSAEQLALAVAESRIGSSATTNQIRQLFHDSMLLAPGRGRPVTYEELLPLIEYSKGTPIKEIGVYKYEQAKDALEDLFHYLYYQMGAEAFMPAVYAYLTDHENTLHPAEYLYRLSGDHTK